MSKSTSRISVRTTDVAELATIEFTGEIDLFTSPRVGIEIERVLNRSRPPRAIHVDLAGVNFMDSVGLAELLTAERRARAQGCHLRVVVLSPPLARLFALSGLTSVLTVDAE